MADPALAEKTPVTVSKARAPRPPFTTEGEGSPSAFFEFTNTTTLPVKVLLNYIQTNVSYHLSGRYAVSGQFPLQLFASKIENFIEFTRAYNYNATDQKTMNDIIAAVTAMVEARKARYDENVKLGRAEFFDLPDMIKRGIECTAHCDGELLAGPVTSVEMKYNWMGVPYMAVALRIVHNMNGIVEEGEYAAKIPFFEGYAKLERLSVAPITPEQRVELEQRGKIFMKLLKIPAYLSYSGHVTQSSWFGNKTYRAMGRVMIDVGSFRRVDSDQHRQELRSSNITNVTDEDGEALASDVFALTEKDAWRTFPFTLGFSLSAKQWGTMKVAELSDIKWRDDAFDKLVLDPRLKELVQALVSNQTGTFEDIIEGKGGGTIFLLHGPPGEGKTLTAEAIAELLHKPLYSISVGELGIDPESLERRLREVLDIATVWDAVILIDEADIFLEERDEHNILRNAMVGVFLRLLEYHQGVLFLTTNRVKKIDTAFYSRISVALSFKKGTSDKRAKIWSNLLSAAKVGGIDVNKLRESELNGRQIKSAIRLSQTLSKARNVPISDELIAEVVELATSFERERRVQKGRLATLLARFFGG